MKSNFTDVGSFHCKFNLEHVSCDHPTGDCNGAMPGPREVPDALMRFRLQFLGEELMEIVTAAGFGLIIDRGLKVIHLDPEVDHAKLFDGLLDLAYVTLGMAHVLGYPWQDGWEAVQRANMAKERALRAEQSTRGSTYDVIKPAGWAPPDIAAVLRQHGFKV
jgi:predicted HAD superfamily Cof-like phosphohydrolase